MPLQPGAEAPDVTLLAHHGEPRTASPSLELQNVPVHEPRASAAARSSSSDEDAPKQRLRALVA